MNADSHTIALLLADARLPSGGYAFSSGVEPALQGGMPPERIAAYLRARVRTTTMVDAATAVVARAAGRRGDPYAPVEQAWAARTPSRAARQSSRELGRGLLHLAARLYSDSAAIAGLTPITGGWSRPVVLGAVAAHADIDPQTLVRIAVYDDMACAVAALLKLEPGDPIDGVRLVIDACAWAADLTPQLAALTSPEAIPATSAPQSEEWAEAHAVTNRRLFRA